MINLHKSPSDVNYSSLNQVPLYVNEVSGGIFGWFSLVCLYVIFAFGISYYKKDIPMGLAISGFIVTIFAILFRILGLINSVHLAICITISVLGLILLLFSKTRE
jgi:hypothetical protein